MDNLKKKGDQELVKAFRETNNDVYFEELFNRYKDKVYSRCWALLGNTEDAQDLTQEIFVKVYLNLKGFKGKASFSTWLYKITTNHCYNFVTRRKPEPTSLEDKKIIKDLITEAKDKSKAIKLDVHKALFSLRPEDRIILIMKYVEGYQCKEIADFLNIKESAAKMRTKRAKEKFKKIYGK